MDQDELHSQVLQSCLVADAMLQHQHHLRRHTDFSIEAIMSSNQQHPHLPLAGIHQMLYEAQFNQQQHQLAELNQAPIDLSRTSPLLNGDPTNAVNRFLCVQVGQHLSQQQHHHQSHSAGTNDHSSPATSSSSGASSDSSNSQQPEDSATTPEIEIEAAESPQSTGNNGKQQQAKRPRPKRFQCPYCWVALSNTGQFTGHLRTHTGERPFRCDHDKCDKTFTRNEELTRHKRIHTGQRPYHCQQCAKSFGRKDHLKKHTRTHEKQAARLAQQQQRQSQPQQPQQQQPTRADQNNVCDAFLASAAATAGLASAQQQQLENGQSNAVNNAAAGAHNNNSILQRYMSSRQQ